MKNNKITHPRLCSEIQLFDLCNVEEVCSHSDGRYCTKEEMLFKFEAIAKDDDGPLEQQGILVELDDPEVVGVTEYDESFELDEDSEGEEAS